MPLKLAILNWKTILYIFFLCFCLETLNFSMGILISHIFVRLHRYFFQLKFNQKKATLNLAPDFFVLLLDCKTFHYIYNFSCVFVLQKH